MSVGAARAHTALFVVALIVAVIVVFSSAAFVGILFGGDSYWKYKTDPAPPIVALVWSFLTTLYFIVYFIVRFVNSHNFFVCIIMDVVFLSVLSIIGIGVMSTMALIGVRGRWVAAVSNGFTGGIPTVGIVVITLGWTLVGMLLIIIAFEVIYTLREYGRSTNFWQLSFLDLTDDTRPLDGPRVRRARIDIEGDEVLPMRAASANTATPFSLPHPDVTPFSLSSQATSPSSPYRSDALPPYEPPADSGLSSVLVHSSPSTSSPSAVVPALGHTQSRQASAGYPFSAYAGQQQDMPDWKIAALTAPMPDWKREVVQGQSEDHLPPGAAGPRPSQ